MTSHGLNDAQRACVEYQGGPLAIVAGPGTGKTRVLAHRVLYLIKKQGIDPCAILTITFTNHAAQEMQKRIEGLLGEGRQGAIDLSGLPRCTTFHSWAYEFIRGLKGEDAIPELLDDVDQKALFHEALSICGHEAKGAMKNRIIKEINRVRGLWPPVQPEDPVIRACLYFYKGLMALNNCMDFDELLIKAVTLLQDPEVERGVRQRYQHVLVDEFQDVNLVQLELIKRIAGTNITVIGDPHQAIYGFRGADPRSFEGFVHAFPRVKTLTCHVAYRCHQEVLDAGLKVLGKEATTQFIAHKGKGPKVIVRGFKDPRKEAAWIAKTIEGITGAMSFEALNFEKDRGYSEERFSLNDIAILVRTRRCFNEIGTHLSKQGIPFKTTWHHSPFEDKGMRAIMRLERLSSGKNPGFHLVKLKKELGLEEGRIKEAAALWNAGKREEAVELLGFKPSSWPVRAYLQLLDKGSIGESSPDPVLYAKTCVDLMDIEVTGVNVMTMHASKGMEFPVVFIPRCESGLIPLEGAEEGEERRLFFVAMTRAENELIITYSTSGKGKSPFIEAFPRETFLEEVITPSSKGEKPNKRKRRYRQATLWADT